MAQETSARNTATNASIALLEDLRCLHSLMSEHFNRNPRPDAPAYGEVKAEKVDNVIDQLIDNVQDARQVVRRISEIVHTDVINKLV